MNQISPQKLMKRYESSNNIKFIFDSLNHSKIKASKKVYNLETRNIRNFIKEEKQMQRKRKAEKSILKTDKNTSGKKYDENQLMELQFKLKKTHKDPIFIQRAKTQSSESNFELKNIKSQIWSNKSGINSFQSRKSNFNRVRQSTYIQLQNCANTQHKSSDNLPRIMMRKKSNSTFDEQLTRKKQPRNFNLNFKIRQTQLNSNQLYESNQKSNLSLKKSAIKIESKLFQRKNMSTIQKGQDKLIQITDDKMVRYLKSLHLLVEKFYDYGKPLDQHKVNNLIIERYRCKGETSIRVEAQRKNFHMPFMQFISETQKRKSIHRIINMSLKNIQKIVFKLLDFNENGFIDEKDIISMIQLSEKIPQIKFDFIKIVRHFSKEDTISITNTKSISYRQDSERQIEVIKEVANQFLSLEANKQKQSPVKPFFKKAEKPKNRSHTYSTSEMSDFIGSSKLTQKKKKKVVSSHKNRFFSFLQSKNQFFAMRKNRDNLKFCLNQQQFNSIFDTQRPAVFFDLMKFLFNIKKQDLINPDLFVINDEKSKQVPLWCQKRSDKSGLKNYNIPEIIKDMQNRFKCDIEITAYDKVLHVNKISEEIQQKNTERNGKEITKTN